MLQIGLLLWAHHTAELSANISTLGIVTSNSDYSLQLRNNFVMSRRLAFYRTVVAAWLKYESWHERYVIPCMGGHTICVTAMQGAADLHSAQEKR